MAKKITLHVLHNTIEGYRVLRRSDELDYREEGEVDTDEQPTVELLAQWLDDEAEGENYHDFVGVHAELAKIITKHSSADTAAKVLADLVVASGLRKL